MRCVMCSSGHGQRQRVTDEDTMNRKLFGAIVVTGAALAACRSGLVPTGGDMAQRDLSASSSDLSSPSFDLARPFDMAGDLKECCKFGPNDPHDLSGCIPIECILI